MSFSFHFMNPRHFRSFLFNVLLLVSSSFLFALQNPGFIFPDGFPFVAWFAYVPVFILISRTDLKTVWIYGFFYGILCYCLYVSWLVTFHPLGIFAISAEYAVLLAPVFLLLKVSLILFPRNGWILQWGICVAYEYLKTTGYGGFNYGVTGYTQWSNLVLIQSADLFGVWGISALILFSSALIAKILLDRNVVKHRVACACFILFLSADIVYGTLSIKDYSMHEFVKVAAVQNNTDPWAGGLKNYKHDVINLISLSKEAVAADPSVRIVVWPETAVVPAVLLNYNEREDWQRYEMISGLLGYIDSSERTFVLGNDHKVRKNGSVIDYNAALVFTGGRNAVPPKPGIYKKIHLVPFTEYFPYEKQFPWLYDILVNGDSHMWTPGQENTVFREEGLTFCTPVCFEDTFGISVRNMYNAGARAIINISNDAWSKSLSCQKQHLAMAVFRCIENRIPAVRATASGQTAVVDPNGFVVKELEPFCKGFLIGELPVIEEDRKPTFYSITGDLFGQIAALISFVFLVFGTARLLYMKFHVKNR